MKARSLAMLACAARIGVGAGLLLQPRRFGRSWVGVDVERPVTSMLVRAVGVRDLIMGAGGVAALATGKPASAWIYAGVVADAGDSVLTVLHFRDLPMPGRVVTLAVTLGGAYAGLRLAGNVDRSSDESETTPDSV